MDKAQELAIRQKLKDNFPHYANKCLKIRTKSGAIEPFVINEAQNYLHQIAETQLKDKGFVRIIVLKGRQQGCSTYIEGRFYHKVSHHFGRRAFILAHEESATANLFEMAKRYHEHCPIVVKPSTKTSNAQELLFDKLEGGYKLGTAGNKAVGRSSTIQYLHCSEAAFYQHADEHAKGILQAVPTEKGTEIFVESTANGVGNWFHQLWQMAETGESDFIPVFIPWFWQKEYTRTVPDDFIPDEEEIKLINSYRLSAGQVVWRRAKIRDLTVSGADGVKAFKQEYPCNAIEAFQLTGDDSYIDPELVMTARKNMAEPYGALVLGVDPARYGDDRTSIAWRRGRVVSKVMSHTKKNTMEVAGIVHSIIESDKPKFVFVDVGGLGAGVVDRLHELGHDKVVIPVNAGSSPLDAKKYFNKRAEMWGTVKEWLQDLPCQLPDIDTLHADLCNTKYKVTSNSSLKMESKEEMKKRGIRSSDEADAVCLTFARPASALHDNQQKSSDIAKSIMATQMKVAQLRRARK